MKLRNKKTGEIRESRIANEHLQLWSKDLEDWVDYDDLDYLAEWWERYEEPKDHYYIDYDGDIMIVEALDYEPKIKAMKQIGNYFETKEEAEKAVEKLKALTEAKEDGLKIKGYYYNHEDLVILADIGKCNKLTLDTLFGKEID